jgi:hypothetical protein
MKEGRLGSSRQNCLLATGNIGRTVFGTFKGGLHPDFLQWQQTACHKFCTVAFEIWCWDWFDGAG